MKIIYGSGNKAKIENVKKYFDANNIDIEILSLKDINFDKEIDENGKTFEENSLIKAKVIKEFCKQNNINEIVVTDDAGLCVDELNGEPGIYSARYAGDHASQEITLNKLMNAMKDIPKEKRTAQFVCVLTALLQNGEVVVAKGITKGSIAQKIGTMGGLTFCPVFIPKGLDRVMNDLTDEEKEETHREKAFKELIKKLDIK